MLIEIVLILLGVITFGLGVWNLIIGAYIWGSLFLIGGIWSIGLGIYYIVQDRKNKKASVEKEPIIDIEVTSDINAPILNEPIIPSETEDIPIEDKTQEELNEFNKAVSFTNDVIPENSINNNFEEFELNVEPVNDNVDRNVEVIQDLVDQEEEEAPIEEIVEVEEINLDDEEIKDSDVKFEN